MLFFLLLVSARIGMVDEIAGSGRCVSVGETPSERVQMRPMIAPGAPPILSFRYFEEKKHHRFNNMDLMLDDAGH